MTGEELLKHHEDRADAAEAEADRLRAFLSAGSLQMLESEQAWKRRALAAEAALQGPSSGEGECMADQDCPGCRGGDKVPFGEYFLCPVCDAEWPGEPTPAAATGGDVAIELYDILDRLVYSRPDQEWRKAHHQFSPIGAAVKALVDHVDLAGERCIIAGQLGNRYPWDDQPPARTGKGA